MEKNIEILSRAKDYMKKLANGIDPISNNKILEDSVVNNIRMSRCFTYVSDVLQQVIDNGGEVKKVKKTFKMPFSITDEEKKQVILSDEPVQISN